MDSKNLPPEIKPYADALAEAATAISALTVPAGLADVFDICDGKTTRDYLDMIEFRENVANAASDNFYAVLRHYKRTKELEAMQRES